MGLGILGVSFILHMITAYDESLDVLAKPDHPLLPGGDTTGRVQLAGGGSSANLAVWAARVGYPTAFVGKVGRDRFGAFAVEARGRAGYPSRDLERDSAHRGDLSVY